MASLPKWCATAFRDATVVLRAPSMQVVAAAIAAGLGFGVLPYRAARLFPQLRACSPVGTSTVDDARILRPSCRPSFHRKTVPRPWGLALPSRFVKRATARGS